jgi:ketosteroid isomerase-like protein
MKRLFLFAATLAALSVIPARAQTAGEKALMQTSRDWAKAAASGNVDTMLAYWADDAVVLPPNQAAITGKAAIRGFVEESLKIPGFSITWEPQSASISADGSLGYLVETNRVSFTGEKGDAVVIEGKAVTVWRKTAAGKWQCVADIWNDNPPPASAEKKVAAAGR